MARHKHRRGQPALALAVLAFVLAGVMLPIVIGGHGQQVTLESADLHASSRDLHAITAPIRLQNAPHISIVSGTLGLKAASGAWGNSDPAKLLASGKATLFLTDAAVVVGPDTGAAVEPAAIDEIGEPLPAALAKSNFAELELRNCEVRLIRADRSTVTLGRVSAVVHHRRKSDLSARGNLTLLGEKLGFDGTLGLLPSGPDRASYPLKASFKGGLVDGRVDGRLTLGDDVKLRGQASLKVTRLRGAARWLGYAWPEGAGLKDFNANGQLDWSGRTLAFQNAKLQMDGNEATGAISVNLASSRPSIEGTVAFDTLDLTQHLGASSPVARAAADVLERAAAHDGTDISMPLVRQADADIRISANQVRLASLQLGRTALTLSLKSGKLLADIAEFEQGGARGSGQLRADMNPDLPRFGIRGKLTGLDLGRVSSTLTGQQVLTGRGEMAVDLAASGETVTQFMRTLDGKASIEVSEGARLGLDLNALLMAPQRRTIEGWSSVARGQTSVEQLVGRFIVSRGVVATEALDATTADAIVTVAGSANLSQRTLDAQVRSARKLAAQAGQSEHVTVRGPWSAPTIRAVETIRKAADQSGPPIQAK